MKYLVQILLVLVITISPAIAEPVAVQASPTITVYDQDELGWKAVVVNWETESFDDATLNPGLSVTATWLDARISDGEWHDRLVAAGEYDGSTGQWGPTTTTWTFAEPIRAFGGIWDPGVPGGPGTSIKVSISGSWVFVGVIPRDYVNKFWGFISDVPFTQILLEPYSSLTGWCETYDLDNMVYSLGQGVKITLPSAGDIFWIEAEPTPIMPTINCQAKVIGITPDPTSSTKFTWDYEIHYNPSQQSEYGPNRDISYQWPSTKSTGGNMQLDFRNVVRGGNLSISVSATINGHTYSDTKTVTIIAENPSVDAIKSQLGDNHTLWRIASVESDFIQFLSSGYPLWSHDKLGGVGIMQLTPPSNDDEIWDWTENCDGGRRKLNSGRAIANRWHTTVQNSLDFKNLVNNYNQMRAQQGLPPLTIKVPKLTAGDFNENVQQRERAAIRMYNGCAGWDPWLPTLRLHEYRIDVSGGVLHVENINEKSLKGEAVWVRVLAAERPQGVGDPNYVEHVLNEPLP